MATAMRRRSETIAKMPSYLNKVGSEIPELRRPSSDNVSFAISNLLLPKSTTVSETGFKVTALCIQRNTLDMRAGHLE